MFIPASKLTAMAILAAVLTCPQISWADTFTSEEFLTWSRDNQRSYFRTSIGMAGLIAKLNDSLQGDCIDRWYFLDEQKAYAQIVSAMKRFPQYHPRGVILAVVEKKCGPIKY